MDALVAATALAVFLLTLNVGVKERYLYDQIESPGCEAGFAGALCDINIDECASDPCANGGTCTDAVNSFSCACMTGWTGPTCATDIDECASNPCDNGGTCSDALDGFTCECPAGYTGTLCATDIDECASEPCANGGTCSDGVDSFECACASGYTGASCETNVDECASDPCSNGGSCVDGVNGYTCACVTGYTGTLCETEIDECASNPCINGGTCTDGLGSYSCTCATNFTGSTCGSAVGSEFANGDSFYQIQNVLQFSGVAGSAEGNSVAVSGDGMRIAVGAPQASNESGYVVVYVKSGPGGTFVNETEALVGTSNTTIANMGFGVALNRAGDTLVALANGAISDPEGVDQLIVFRRTGSTWSQEASGLSHPDNSSLTYCDISADGDTIVASSSSNASLLVWSRNGTEWSLSAGPLVPPLNSTDHTHCVALAADVLSAVVCAANDQTYGVGQGACYETSHNGTDWEEFVLLPDFLDSYIPVGRQLGFKNCDINADATTFVVMSRGNESLFGANRTLGYAHVYSRNETGLAWEATKGINDTLTPPMTSQELDLAIDATATTLVVSFAIQGVVQSGFNVYNKDADANFSDYPSQIEYARDWFLHPYSTAYGIGASLNDAGTLLAIGDAGVSSNIGGVFIYERGVNTVDASCDSNPCQNGGTCTANDPGPGYTCSCPVGYGDDECSTDVATNFTLLQPKIVQLGQAGAEEGIKVSVSGDGTRIAVGAYLANSNAGGAYILVRNGSNGTFYNETDLFVGTNVTAGTKFGRCVALDDLAETLLVTGEGDGISSGGAFWIFTRNGSTWTEQVSGLYPDGHQPSAPNRIGARCALSGDGTTVFLPVDFNYSFYTFSRSGSDWNETAGPVTVTPERNGGPITISASYDGTVVALGAYQDATYGNSIGSAYMFMYNGTEWSQTSDLASLGLLDFDLARSGAFYGLYVWVAEDGLSVAVGASEYGINAGPEITRGPSLVYRYVDGNWSGEVKFDETAVLPEKAETVGLDGVLASNGTLLIASGEDQAIGSASVNVYRRVGGAWGKAQVINTTSFVANRTSSFYGCSGSRDGSVFTISYRQDDSNTGAVWVFVDEGL